MKMEAWFDYCDKMEGAGAVYRDAGVDWEHFYHER